MHDSVDLHVHTTASDGSFSPSDVVKMAEAKGLKAVGITDHDTLGGHEEALTSGADREVEVVPGVEVSAKDDRLGKVHVLGLWISNGDTELSCSLKEIVRDKKNRNERIIELLNQYGYELTFQEVEELAGDGVMGRPHIAQALVNRGYVRSVKKAFRTLLGKEGKAYVDRKRLSMDEAINLIRKAGGVSVLAHPALINVDMDVVEAELDRLHTYGLGGLEAYYPRHKDAEESRLLDLCKRFDLAPCGGTDFHGKAKPDIELGGIHVPAKVLEALRNRT